jgi:hypothetical protein
VVRPEAHTAGGICAYWTAPRAGASPAGETRKSALRRPLTTRWLVRLQFGDVAPKRAGTCVLSDRTMRQLELLLPGCEAPDSEYGHTNRKRGELCLSFES